MDPYTVYGDVMNFSCTVTNTSSGLNASLIAIQYYPPYRTVPDSETTVVSESVLQWNTVIGSDNFPGGNVHMKCVDRAEIRKRLMTKSIMYVECKYIVSYWYQW